jgi:hypothetical protein
MNEAGARSRAQICAHIERHIGPIGRVFREADGRGAAGIEVHHVAPVDTRPCHTLVTIGMSDAPMPVPADVDAPRYLELMVTLPAHWKLDDESRTHERWDWPIRLLRSLACFPREHHTWLGWGHTVPNGDPPRAFAPNTDLCGAIIAPSLLVPVGFYQLDSGGRHVGFFSAIPLYREELELKLRDGMEALLSRLLRYDINDVIEPKRRNVARKFLGLF